MIKNKLNKEKTTKILNVMLVIFLIIQPIFDLKPFYNSISTLIRVVAVFTLFLIHFIIDENKKKWYLLLYPIIVFIYFIFHHINATNFKSLVPGNFNYSITKEALYFVKMITPFELIYVLFKAKLSKDQTLKIIKCIVLIMSLTIIITNICGISYGSYSEERIKGNFFQWFSNKNQYTYQDLASKGLFKYANQIGAVLVMFLPFLLINANGSEKHKDNVVIIMINIFALFILGTKVATFGIAIDFLFVMCIKVFEQILNKEKGNTKIKLDIALVVPVIFYLLILPISPTINRELERKRVIETYSNAVIISNDVQEDITIQEMRQEDVNIVETGKQTLKIDETEKRKKEIEEMAKTKNLPEQFFKVNYPYDYDIEFWEDLIQKDIAQVTNYRFIETEMIKRVISINNNKMDMWLGITNTRLQDVFNIERDFLVQYYALGMIGLILVSVPYFIMIGYYLHRIIKSKFKSFSNINATAFMSILMLFGVSYYSGNLLNSLSFTIYFPMLFYILSIEAE